MSWQFCCIDLRLGQWPITIQHLGSLHQHCLCSLLRISWWDLMFLIQKYCNWPIWWEYWVLDYEKLCSEYLVCLEDTHIAKQLLYGRMVQDKCLQWKPQEHYKDCLKDLIKKFNRNRKLDDTKFGELAGWFVHSNPKTSIVMQAMGSGQFLAEREHFPSFSLHLSFNSFFNLCSILSIWTFQR